MHRLSLEEKSRLTTWLIDQRRRASEIPLIDKDTITSIRNRRLLQVHERAHRLLSYMAEHTAQVGDRFRVPFGDPCALAHSESTSGSEVYFLLDYLKQVGWIGGTFFQGGAFEGELKVEGYSRIAAANTSIDSSQAFVAMWFDDSIIEAYKQGVEKGIKEAGYKPLRIDQKEHINKIDDEIIAEIRRSRFLIADFTQGPDGARGGVYYEAGFAAGLGIPVIYTCKRRHG